MKIAFVSLGCAKNLVNTEQMMALVKAAGHTVTGDPEGADVAVLNTCGFIDSAKSEAIQNILELAALKDQGKLGKLLVAGCLTQRYRDEILGKPADEAEALDMLSLLAGRTHQVYTGVTLVRKTASGSQPKIHSFYEKTDVEFYPIHREDLLSYIRTGDPLDKAGSYGIQGPFAIHVKGIQGDYNNVVGLPIARLYQEIRQF